MVPGDCVTCKSFKVIVVWHILTKKHFLKCSMITKHIGLCDIYLTSKMQLFIMCK